MSDPDTINGVIINLKKRVRKGWPDYVIDVLLETDMVITYNGSVDEIKRIRDACGCSAIDELIGKKMVLKRKVEEHAH